MLGGLGLGVDSYCPSRSRQSPCPSDLARATNRSTAHHAPSSSLASGPGPTVPSRAPRRHRVASSAGGRLPGRAPLTASRLRAASSSVTNSIRLAQVTLRRRSRPWGVDDPQVVETIDEGLIADAEAEQHARQAVRSSPIAVDRCSDLRLEHQERRRERVGRPLLIGASPKIPVDVDRGPVAVQDVPQLVRAHPSARTVRTTSKGCCRAACWVRGRAQRQ